MIYLDYAATTPLNDEVLVTYEQILKNYFANSDSLHQLGRESQKLLEQSRANIAQLFHVKNDEIIFCGSASEANNMAIKGCCFAYQNRGKHIITSEIEHSSVAKSIQQLQDVFGYEVSYAKVNEEGIVLVEEVQKLLRKDTVLVSIMLVNNEIGAIQPICEIANYVHEHSRAIMHCDAVQALGKIDIPFAACDLLSCSAHKIYGLKGSAFLYKKEQIQLLPLISGGQQEFGLRAGTSNYAVDIVLAKTIRLALEKQAEYFAYVKDLNTYLRKELSKIDDIEMNSSQNSVPHILSIASKSIGSEVMQNALNAKGIAISAQSTCSSKQKSHSKVILAMGLSEQRATHTIRISLSFRTTKAEIDLFIKALKEIIYEYRTS